MLSWAAQVSQEGHCRAVGGGADTLDQRKQEARDWIAAWKVKRHLKLFITLTAMMQQEAWVTLK